jgi:hypothetical protein
LNVFYKPILFASVCSALLAMGCSDDDDDDERPSVPPLGVGTLQFSWTIGGESDLAACEAVDATAFEAQVFDQGFFVNGARAPCDEFATTLELYVDDYVSRVTLVDPDGYAVTRRVVEDYFQIEEGQVTRLSFDFPTEPTTDPDAASEADAGADAGAL